MDVCQNDRCLYSGRNDTMRCDTCRVHLCCRTWATNGYGIWCTKCNIDAWPAQKMPTKK